MTLLAAQKVKMVDKTLDGMAIAWLVSLVATLGALFIGEVMGQMPCVTCWYQRIAMFPITLVLGIALMRSDASAWIYALPLALIGTIIAAWHSLLHAGIIPAPIVPCTASGPSCTGADQLLFGIVPIPYLSLTAFIAIAAALSIPKLLRKVDP